MLRRTLAAVAAITAGAAALAATLAAAGPAAADPAGASVFLGPHRHAAVCGAPAPGFAGCNADVLTDTSLRPLATTSYSAGYVSTQLRKVYGLTGNATTTIAVVDAYASPKAAADLAAYRTRFGLGTANFTQYNQTGGTSLPRGDTGWGQEEMLDLDMVSAICPGCKILYVGANSTSFADLGAAVDTAVAKGAKVVSNSYGGAEWSGENAYASHYDHPGVAITVSTGDDGYGVQVPAAYRTVTAVGGTTLTLKSDNTRLSETVWGGAGSGCSLYITKATWQGDKGCTRRTVADVSAVADPDTGVAVYDSYGSSGGANWYVFGGTSVAAPIIAGVYGLSGNTAAYPTKLLYTKKGALFDVTSGNNGSCAPTYLCTGGKGFDGPTGKGTPIGVAAF